MLNTIAYTGSDSFCCAAYDVLLVQESILHIEAERT